MRGAPMMTTAAGIEVPSVVSADEAGELLRISGRAVRGRCQRGRFPGATFFANQWWIPTNAVALRYRAELRRELTVDELLAVTDRD